MEVITKVSNNVIHDSCGDLVNRCSDWDIPSWFTITSDLDGTETEIIVNANSFKAVPGAGSGVLPNGDTITWTGKTSEGTIDKLTGVTWSESSSTHARCELVKEVLGSHTYQRYDADVNSWDRIIGGTYDGETFTAKAKDDYLVILDGAEVDSITVIANNVDTKIVTVKAKDGPTGNDVTNYSANIFKVRPQNALIAVDVYDANCSPTGELAVAFGPSSLIGDVIVNFRINDDPVSKVLVVEFRP